MPGASGLILPDSPVFTVVGSTDEFAAFAGAPKDDLIGKSLFTHFPDNPDAPNVSNDIRASLAICIREKRKNELEVQRYDIVQPDGTFNEMYWTVIHTPIFNENREIEFIIHTAVNVTDRMQANIKDEKIKSLEPAHNLFRQSAMAIHIFKGPDLIIELANEPTLRLWDKDASVIGKPLREVLPELASQRYIEIIDTVRRTGMPYQAHEAPVTLIRHGKEEILYFNFVLQPYYENGKAAVTGVVAMANEVTQLHNDRKALVQKERSLELAEEIGGMGVFNIDLRSNTVSYSPQIMEWFGVTRLNIPLPELLKKVYQEDYALVRDTFTGVTREGSSGKHDIIFRVPHPQTRQLQHLRSIGQVQDEDGEAVTVSCIIQDISASIHSKFAIEQSAQRLRSVIDSAPFPIGVYIGREMRIEMANQSILDTWDRDSSVIGKRYAEVLPELEGQGPIEQLDRVYTTGVAFHAHNQHVKLLVGGRLQSFYFNYSFTPLFDAMGKVYGVMNTAANVTDLVVAKKALEESERNFRNIILQAPVAMCLLRGPEHTVEIANDLIINLWGKSYVDVMNKPLFVGLPDAREQGLEELLQKVYTTGETFTANERPVELIRFGQKQTLYQNFVYEAYRDGEGQILGVLAISVDVTPQVIARRKIEQVVKERTKELEHANERLQKSNAELEQFAYIASHDLQEPLRKISLFTQILESSLGEIDDKSKFQMARITNAVNRMMNLIRDILGYSQLSRKNEVFVATNLEDVFNDIISDFDVIVEEKQAVIEHSGLPVIDTIPLQMTQLFSNLISNSLKYSRLDVPPHITISSMVVTEEEASELELAKKSGGYYKIIFTDNGIGFPQEYASRIFNIFQRLHGKTEYEGTGIGLAMCKKIAENHHGLIFANGTEGAGAEFVVVLAASQQNLS
jgi:hypothetical protein